MSEVKEDLIEEVAPTEGETPEVVVAPEVVEGEPPETPEQVEFVIAGEEPAAEEPSEDRDWLKKLRADSRELARLKREREHGQQPQAMMLGPKPKAADFNYDTDAFETALDTWHTQKARVDAMQAEQQARINAETAAWQGTLNSYVEQKAQVSKVIPHFDELEAAVNDRLSLAQQGVLLHVAGKRAEIVAALGASPKALAKLSAITDPLLLSAEIARMEAGLTTAQRKAPPPPERSIRGGANTAVASKSRLDDLKAKADQTGNYTEYFKAKNAAKAKA